MAEPGGVARHGRAAPRHRPPRRTGWSVAAGLAVTAAVLAAAFVGVTAAWPWYVHSPTGTATATAGITTDGANVVIRRDPDSADDPDGAPHARLVAAIMTDVATFWSQTFPGFASRDFTPLRGGVTAMDSAVATGGAPCVDNPARIVGNAFFCPDNDGIIYDSAVLVPVVLHRYGDAGLVSTFAHEFGHVVQARLNEVPSERAGSGTHGSGTASGGHPQDASLFAEAQADCYAGAFWAWVVADHAPHIHLTAGSLVDAVGPLADFADPPGIVASDPTAHGRAVDRVTWMLHGYRHGVGRCRSMTTGALSTGPDVSAAFGKADTLVTTPRYPSRTALLTAASKSLHAFAPRHADPTVGPDVLDAVAPYGQFAEATALAFALGRERAGDGAANAAQNAAGCFAGAWVRSVFGHGAAGQLGSWPGDADAGLAAIRHRPHATFRDVTGYIDGFDHGRSACRGGQ